MPTLNEIADEAHQIAIAKGWWQYPARSFGELIALVHSEASEALECYRENMDIGTITYNEEREGKPEGIPAELADIVIRVCDMARRYSIDLDSAVRIKMDYNKNRAIRHGGKVI